MGEFENVLWGYVCEDGFCSEIHGREARTFQLDVDELCWFLLEEFAVKCGCYNKGDHIYYLIPDAETFEMGLRRVYSDDEVRVMSDVMVKFRCISCYVVAAVNAQSMAVVLGYGASEKTLIQSRKKLSPRRKKSEIVMGGGDQCIIPCGGLQNTKNTISKEANPLKKDTNSSPLNQPSLDIPEHNEDQNTKASTPKQTQNQISPQVEHYNTPFLINITQPQSQLTQDANLNEQPSLDRPLSPFTPFETFADLQAEQYEAKNYEAQNDENANGEGPIYGSTGQLLSEEDVDEESESQGLSSGEEWGSDSDTDDEEFRDSRRKIEAWNAAALSTARDLQQKALQGTVTRSEKGKSQEETEADTVEDEFVSDYDESGDELNTESEGEDNEVGKRKKKRKCLVVNSSTDFSNLKWVVGIRFPNREEFKECVTRYAVAQGRNLTWVVSDKGRQQRLGVKCNPGCPFRLYCSWDSRRAAFVVKSVEDQHTCVRNMESNRQLKSTWLAKQFLELFKSRPHWPAKEIVETIRVAYRVLVKVGFAYKVKYYAHRLLHGSMKEHYSKLGRYLEALKESSPNSYFKLEVDNSTHPATFDKVFFCFDGVKQGWLKGCRKVLCVDGCFFKTFLGGMLLSAIGRDANEQMYPLAWAVVEGETNASWQWFLSHLKKAVGEEDGHGWTIISDENPVRNHVLIAYFKHFILQFSFILICFRL
ncbi:Serum amyloid A protein [Bienertia sinuspersici]